MFCFFLNLFIDQPDPRNSLEIAEGLSTQKLANEKALFSRQLFLPFALSVQSVATAEQLSIVCDVIQAVRWHSTLKPRFSAALCVFHAFVSVFFLFFQGFIVAIFFDEIIVWKESVAIQTCLFSSCVVNSFVMLVW